MDTFEHGLLKVALEDVGTGTALVFLHNGGTSSAIWRHQVEAFRATHHVIAVDLPGFGASERPEVAPTLEELVDLIIALIEARTEGPVVLVGNCMGSNIAAGVTAKAPDLVSGVILINPLTAATFSAGSLGLLYRVHRRLPGPSGFARKISRRVVPPKVGAVAALRLQVGSKGAAAGVHHDPALVACGRRGDQLPSLVDVLDDMDAYGGLDEDLDLGVVPVCTIWGLQNRVLSAKAGRSLDERLDPVRHVALAECGHLPMLEDPDAVNDVIQAFLEHDVTAGSRADAAR